MKTNYDFLVIGAGIAGASTAFALCQQGDGAVPEVLMVEREAMAGYHTTGRSAAHYTETNGPSAFRALTRGSRRFYESPPRGFADHSIVSPRGKLHIARQDQVGTLESFYEDCRRLGPGVRFIDGAEARRLNPSLSEAYVAAGVHQPSMDIDVHALHQGYIRSFKTRGGTLILNAGVLGLERVGGRWQVHTEAGSYSAAVVVNAAGAWADVIAELAGLSQFGLVPKRRTVIQFDAPEDLDCRDWPQTVDVGEAFYFKPDAGRIFASPADETTSPPCDAQPEEIDIAVAVDRIEAATNIKVRRILSKWAGLRSFFPDNLPAIGPDPREPTFVWVAGQGGFGIKTSYAIGRVAAALATGRPVPDDMKELGLEAADILPDRLLARP